MNKIIKGVHVSKDQSGYVLPDNPLLRERLEWFRDQKLALMIHFGLYVELGICASWPLSDENAWWSRKGLEWEPDADKFREQYFGLSRSFNPIRFEPEKWAEEAKNDGFRYLIFTTKHHDGFCLFDTKQTDYKVTSKDCPFHTHRYADVTKHLMDAFRQKGLGIAAYFSKADWHSPFYWAPDMELPVGSVHNTTYDTRKHPEIWKKYLSFAHRQMMELVRDYGRIDIMWLDSGQVCPQNGQDFRMNQIVGKMRKIQPWLIVADRTVGGENENYLTPEKSLPDQQWNVPWEVCMTVGKDFSYNYDDTYKSAGTLIRMLIKVVARGGNLALNLSPQPDGRMPEKGLESLCGLGEWLKKNGEAIYETRPYRICEKGGIFYTCRKDSIYALIPSPHRIDEEKDTIIPVLEKIIDITDLASGTHISYCQKDGVIRAVLGPILRKGGSMPLALRMKTEGEEYDG
ncbi:MAG TPA: alpha-L-fucosidase [Lachnospiraceae bacterium]|nr:alpha-L-fucosidase [Lachnospiraceae bacterium]